MEITVQEAAIMGSWSQVLFSFCSLNSEQLRRPPNRRINMNSLQCHDTLSLCWGHAFQVSVDSNVAQGHSVL